VTGFQPTGNLKKSLIDLAYFDMFPRRSPTFFREEPIFIALQAITIERSVDRWRINIGSELFAKSFLRNLVVDLRTKLARLRATAIPIPPPEFRSLVNEHPIGEERRAQIGLDVFDLLRDRCGLQSSSTDPGVEISVPKRRLLGCPSKQPGGDRGL
jgi:hypothetical protein